MLYDLNGNALDGTGPGMKTALLQLAEKAAYDDDSGPVCYQDLYAAVYPDRTLSSISASFSLLCHTVMAGDSPESLRHYITVTATYGDGYTAAVKGYTLSGTISSGSNTITVAYQGKTAALTVTAVAALPSGYTRLPYVYTDGRQYINTGLNGDDVDKAVYEAEWRNEWFEAGGNLLSSDTTKFPYLSGDSTNGFRSRILFNYGGTTTIKTGSSLYSWNFGDRHVLAFDNGSVSVDGTAKFTVAKGSATSEPLYLFVCGASKKTATDSNIKYAFVGALYEMKLYKNSALVAHYIPCKDSNGEAGLYDLVGSTFLKSGSEKKLLRGGEV